MPSLYTYTTCNRKKFLPDEVETIDLLFSTNCKTKYIYTWSPNHIIIRNEFNLYSLKNLQEHEQLKLSYSVDINLVTHTQ